MKRLTRYELRERWIQRELREHSYIGNLKLTDPDVRHVVEYAWLMGYGAREKQDSRRKAKQP
jgi:hypothetical protein